MKKIGLVLAFATVACGDKTAPDAPTAATLAVKAYIETENGGMCVGAAGMLAAAPTHAWDKTADAAAITQMKAQWKATRESYERVEGAIAVLFPELDFTMDARYEDFIETTKDTNLFDGEGVTGMHAIERVLFSDTQPAGVIAAESKLENYVAAAFPATNEEANSFRTGLVQRFVDECGTMQTQFKSAALDSSTAFRGVIGSLREQHEKVLLANTSQEESRYSQNTLGDMRANLDGGMKIYASFKTWVRSTTDGVALDASIEAGFADIKNAYDEAGTSALPAVPANFNPDAPTAAHLQTPYGVLYQKLSLESDDTQPASLVSKMGAAADALNIPQLPQ